jgi:hypothetical protein
MEKYLNVEGIDGFLVDFGNHMRGINLYKHYDSLVSLHNTLALQLIENDFCIKAEEILEKSLKYHDFLDLHNKDLEETVSKGITYSLLAYTFYIESNYESSLKQIRISEIISEKPENSTKNHCKVLKIFNEILSFMCLYKLNNFNKSKSKLDKSQILLSEMYSNLSISISNYANLVAIVMVGIVGIILQLENNISKAVKLLKEKKKAYRAIDIESKDIINQITDKLNSMHPGQPLKCREYPEILTEKYQTVLLSNTLKLFNYYDAPVIRFYKLKNSKSDLVIKTIPKPSLLNLIPNKKFLKDSRNVSQPRLLKKIDSSKLTGSKSSRSQTIMTRISIKNT